MTDVQKAEEAKEFKAGRRQGGEDFKTAEKQDRAEERFKKQSEDAAEAALTAAGAPAAAPAASRTAWGACCRGAQEAIEAQVL